MSQFAGDERVVWLSYSRLDDAISSVLDEPVDLVAERERFLLRELSEMFRQEGLVGGFDAVVVAGRISWPEYLEWGLYACQAERAFRDVPYLGFYADKEIKPKLGRRLKWMPSVSSTTTTPARCERRPTLSTGGSVAQSLRFSSRRGVRHVMCRGHGPVRTARSRDARYPTGSSRRAGGVDPSAAVHLE